MRKVVSIQEVEGEGLMALLNEKVILLCLNYIYIGLLTGVNETCVQLENPSLVYETGEWSAPTYKDAQRLPMKHLYVNIAAIEAFGKQR
jgi:hypothetical protein